MIPHILYQLWEENPNPIPSILLELGNTWKEKHPDWIYEFWDKNRMDCFVETFYPEFLSVYYGYIYDVQRWDMVRYLILYKQGGVYVDFDYECIESIESLLENKTCCFPLEPIEHSNQFGKPFIISNSLIACIPGHPFIGSLLDSLRYDTYGNREKLYEVLETTGPFKITRMYEAYPNKEDITLIPTEIISPFSKDEVTSYIAGTEDRSVLEEKLNKAKAVHYFFSSWMVD